MQPADRAARMGQSVVFLDERADDPGIPRSIRAPGFGKETSPVAMAPRQNRAHGGEPLGAANFRRTDHSVPTQDVADRTAQIGDDIGGYSELPGPQIGPGKR